MLKSILTKENKVIILVITGVLFSLSYFFGIAAIIINVMSFLILMEAVRTVWEYVTNPEHRIKVRYIIDSAILFGVREIFVGWVMLKTNLELGLLIMFVSFIGVGVLLKYRR